MLTASVAIVRCAENSDHILIVAPVVTLHHQLVCAANELQTIRVVELLADILYMQKSTAYD